MHEPQAVQPDLYMGTSDGKSLVCMPAKACRHSFIFAPTCTPACRKDMSMPLTTFTAATHE